jgi:predicted hotdog family 3-hydroxylacyl-ACP dehydratase
VKRDRDWIERHIPHQGRMCLLDEVRCWDATFVECTTHTHHAADHPLRYQGRLGAGCALEYAAQAMAVHGALLGLPVHADGAIGMLTSAREVDLFVTRLDDLVHDLLVRAERLHAGPDGALYSFSVTHAGQLLAQGRASLRFGLRPRAPGSAARTGGP